MRNYNGYGSITKLSGNRRRPWMVRITTEIQFDSESKRYDQKQKVLGYYSRREDAIKALADYNHDPYDLNTLTTTFGECYEAIFPTFGENQQKSYGNAYKYFNTIKDMPIRSLRTGHLQDCVNLCTNTQQPIVKSLCRKVYEYALMQEIIDKNPSQYIKAVTSKTKIVRTLFDHQQVEELWTLTDHWWVCVTLMLLYSGMRTKELRCVPLDRIDLDNRWITLQDGKNEYSVRGLPIHKRTVPLFKRYIEAGGNLYDYSHGALNKALNAFHDHSAHDARHTFTTRMREIKTDSLVIKRLLGHTPDDITERIYTHLSQEELTAAIDKLEY